MGGEPRFLRQDVIVEPLVDGFYAWLHTVAPVQAAMNLAFSQVPLLESYLQSPQVHVNASANPDLRGGFFVNVPESRAGEVRDLLASLRRERAGMLGLAGAVGEAEEVVRQGAAGFDLTPLYGRLPGELAGLVEVADDTSNQPQVGYLEPVAYACGAYDVSRQRVQLSVEPGTERPFIMSTPRLGGAGGVEGGGVCPGGVRADDLGPAGGFAGPGGGAGGFAGGVFGGGAGSGRGPACGGGGPGAVFRACVPGVADGAGGGGDRSVCVGGYGGVGPVHVPGSAGLD